MPQCPDYGNYGKCYSFNDGEEISGLNIRVTSNENIYTRVRLVLELPVFDILDTASLI